MVLILGGQSDNVRPCDKILYERRLDILPFDNQDQSSKILRQWKFEYILSKLGKLWKIQGNIVDIHSIIIILPIHRISHKNKHIIAITNSNGVTWFGNANILSDKTIGLQKKFSNYQRIIRNELH